MTQRRKRRTEEEQIADLKAEIERLKARAAEKKVKKDPALRHISGAIKAIDKAASLTEDKATSAALGEARVTLAACLGLNGAVVPSSTRGRKQAGPAPDPKRVLDYISRNPGTRSKDICEELNTDPGTLRPVLHQLRDDGQIESEGKARAMRYRSSV